MNRISSRTMVNMLSAEPAPDRGDDLAYICKQIDDVCILLFDRWCERSEITPLLYLLHAWRLLPSMLRAASLYSASRAFEVSPRSAGQ
jgi:hypothetical protein